MDKHIKTFEFLLDLGRDSLVDVLQPEVQTAFRDAIDLMRAAQPKYPKAEREHCEKTIILREWQKGLTADELMASRQEARIEACAGKGMQEFRRVQAQLSAAQVEIGRLRADYAKAGQDYASECKLRDMLETKLSNLRTAAERALLILGESEIAWHLRGMVEASR